MNDFLVQPQTDRPALDAVDAAIPPNEALTASNLKDWSPLDQIPEAAQYLPSDRTLGDVARNVAPILNTVSKDTVDQIAGATADSVEGLGKFLTTGTGLAATGLSEAGPIGAGIVGGTFAHEAINNIPDAWKSLTEAKTPRDITTALENLGMSVAMIGGPVVAGFLRGRALPTEGGEQPNAVQESQAGTLLQREPAQAGETGGERGRVEQGQQGQEAADAGVQVQEVAPTPIGKITQKLDERQKTTDPVRRQQLWDEARALLEQEKTSPPAAAVKPPSTGQEAVPVFDKSLPWHQQPSIPGEPDYMARVERAFNEIPEGSVNQTSGYRIAVRLPSGRIEIARPGEGHGELAGLLSDFKVDRGYVNRKGEFLSALDVAREEMKKKEGVEGAPAEPAPPSEEQPVESIASDWTSATEEQPKAMKLGSEESGAIPSPTYPTRKMSELDMATAERSAKLQKSFDEAQRAQKEINKAIPDKDRQRAAAVYREADGDAAVLADWEANAKQDWMKKAAKDARTLTPKEVAIVDKAKAAFDVLEKRGNAYGVLTGHKENYVPHIWDVGEGKGFSGPRRLQERFKFNKARTIDTFFEGDQAGLKPKNFALGDVLPAYLHEMNKVIADRQFVQDLVNGKSKTGEPLAVPRGRVTTVPGGGPAESTLVMPKAIRDADTSHYKILPDQPALSDWTWQGKDTNGNPVFVKADLALHPEAVRRLKSVLGASPIREWMNDPAHEGASKILPSIAKGLDVAQSTMKREMFGLLAPFHQVQEGTHAIGHTVNPFFNIPKVDLRDPAQMDAARHGLMLLPDRSSSSMYLEGVGGKSSFLSQAARWVGEKTKAKAITAISDVIDGYQNYLFHQYIPGLKFKTYESILDRNTKLYDSELKSGKLQDKDIKLLSAEQTNAAYGHLNYDLLDRNPLMKHLSQLTLLAPDFLEARARFVGQAAKALTGSKAGLEQFRAIAVLAMIQAGAAYTISKLLGVDWDAKHPFEVMYNNRRYGFRSVPADLVHAITDTRKFVYGRVNPLLVKGAIQEITGLNYRGEKVGSLDTAEELLAQYIPITARSLPGLRELNKTTRDNPVSPTEQLAGALGLHISRYSPISETYKRAGDWMEKQGIPKDKGSYPVSKYSQLRYALEDNNTEKASKEYQKLRKDQTPIQIATGFRSSLMRPFTKNQQTDSQFYRDSSPDDRKVIDLAKKRRGEISLRFGLLPKS